MRVVAGGANFTIHSAQFALPIAARSAMNARVPIAVSGAVTTAAQRRTIHQLHLVSVTSLEEFEIRFVVAVETVVVPLVASMAHLDVTVLLREDDVALRIEFQRRRFSFLVAGVTIQPRGIAP